MNTCTTQGIKITVIATFQKEHSNPQLKRFVFSYEVIIKNESDYTVQLIERHWHIYDSNGNHREVKGEGVIGKQPILKSGHSHSYTSWCPFNSDIGMMKGHFKMYRKENHELIEVKIPAFTMVADAKLN